MRVYLSDTSSKRRCVGGNAGLESDVCFGKDKMTEADGVDEERENSS